MTALELFESRKQDAPVASVTPDPLPKHVVLTADEVVDATDKKRARALAKANGVQVRFYSPQDIMDTVRAAGEVKFGLANATDITRTKGGYVAFTFENGDIVCRITVPADAATESVTLKV